MLTVDKYRKVKYYQRILDDHRWKSLVNVQGITKLDISEYKVGQTLPNPKDMQPFGEQDRWGNGEDTHAWFHFTLPAVGENTYLVIKTDKNGWDAANPQFILYVNGQLRMGVDIHHMEFLLEPGQETDIYLYAYTAHQKDPLRLFAQLGVLDLDVMGLLYDIRYPYDSLQTLNEESDEYAKILDYLFHAVSMLDLYDVGSQAFSDSAKAAREYMATEFYGKYCQEQKTTVVGIGHTHIDCAWLWTLKQTREKVQRSFSTVLELMKQYPEYKFMSSQALLYKYLKEEAPELYEQVKERVKEGRWEVEGAMWVEADCNLSSGESLIRQVQYGKNWFREEFGVENKVLWLPDVFGYSAALPQILKKSGVDWFLTSKISWNDVNRMPYDTFDWKGLDGTKIHSYFLTAQDASRNPTRTNTTYVGNITAQQMVGTVKRYQQKDLSSEVLHTFGFGDGGGGPTTEMLENARRGAYGIPGSPNVKIEFAGDFLKRLATKIEGNPQLPTWCGELYLEFHRGTYTTHSHNKRNNRKSEFLLQRTEWLSTMGRALKGLSYPKEELHALWEDVLTHQFHDIIPGSSIREAYEESDLAYAHILSEGGRMEQNVIDTIAQGISKDEGYVIFNPTSFTGRMEADLNGERVYAHVPSLGYTTTKDLQRGNHVQVEGHTVTTDLYVVTFDDAWQIQSIWDKRCERDVLNGVGNELRLYADYPDTFDAWEWQAYVRESQYRVLKEVQSMEVVDGGIRKGIRVVRPLTQSTLTQTIWFYDDVDKIEFETHVDWHQRKQTLRVAFPVDIYSDKATYEVQFGTLERPTHMNTSWDAEKFEVCAQKYADLSDGGYGVSILNDCKYGHDIHDGVIQLSLLRSPIYPDPEADQGLQDFTYAICPHMGTLAESDTVRMSYALNNPCIMVPAMGNTTTLPTAYSAVQMDSEHVICETVKQEEYGDSTILRFYECANKREKVTIRVSLPCQHLYLCDLSENILGEIPQENGVFEYTFKGFEIATFKIV